MRVTQNYTNRSYLRNNNKILSHYTKSMEKIYSGMDYFRASENPINASKAMTVRKSLRDLDMYDDNLETADGVLKAAEDSLYSIANNIYLNVQTKLETACNGTYDKDVDLQILATEIEEYAKIAIETLNTDYAERNLFGGTNNSSSPFATEVDETDGKTYVTYNGVRVNDLTEDTIPYDNPIYVDIGIGIKYDEDGNVVEQTALDIGLNGAEITGYGTEDDVIDIDGTSTEVTFSKNFVQLIFDAAASLKDGDTSTANAILDRLNTANTGILTEITTLGTKQNRVEFYLNKNDEQRISLQSRQNDVEGVDTESEIVTMDSLQAAYNAALQMNAQVLPSSIFDFI
ncbi:MAG: hypothetical protein LUI05_03445 [Oscillospiraceae bacterium]|nr:hypothetical protein [Oscillospiraceae bacterium]